MDLRAKQRLTGAIILVALFVLLVPELLTGPGGSGDSAPQTKQEGGLRQIVIDLEAPEGATPGTPKPTAASDVALPPVTQNPMASMPAPEPSAVRAQPGEAATIQEPEVASPAAPRSEAVEANPVAATGAAANRPAPAPAAPATKPPTRAEGGFAVQLGSFSSKENADRLVRDMTAKGFSAFVAPISSGGRELYRVRVGPARDRGSAEALAAQLRRIGQTGSIVPIS